MTRALQAARAWGVRPTKYLRWSARDRGLAEGLLALEADACPGCGNPRRLAWDESTEGEWDVRDHTCMACKAREQDADGKQRRAGQYRTVTRGSLPGALDAPLNQAGSDEDRAHHAEHWGAAGE